MKDIAARLVDALSDSQVQGPYCLAGWSLAGLIAYEMAQQLRSCGQKVAFVILFDTNNPDYLRRFQGWRKMPIQLYFFVAKCLYYLRKARGMPFRSAWQYVRDGMRKFQLESQGRRAMPHRRAPGRPAEQPLTLSWQAQYHAAADYEPQPCDSPLVLFRSQVLQTGLFRDPRLGWGDVARGGLQVYAMPGEHDAMFLEPDVQQLASILKECLSGSARGDTPAPRHSRSIAN
jgi:thioesterase domain-containing protein